MTRRMDMITAVTRLLLDNSTFSEAVTLQRCARLLAGGLAGWVIVDIERAGVLRRQFVVGPPDGTSQELARKIRTLDPQADSAPAQVHAAVRSVLQAHADDPAVLGSAADDTPLLMLIGASSLLSVPITDGMTCYGALTLARTPGEGRFEIADLALAEELGQHLGVAIRVDRMFRQRSAVAETLQGSLLPATLPEVPGLDLSAAYQPATGSLEVSGDFYDVFPVAGGWAIAVGDVCGKGQEAAAMTAAARHAIRAIAHWDPDPVDVLAKVNELMLAGDYEDRFVTAKLAYLRWQDGQLRVRLASAGHPGPALVRPDGRVEVLNGGGLPLGLFPDADPQAEDLELGEDDLLFFYSDGLTDARSPDMRYFDDSLADELARLAGRPAAETVRMVQSLVSSFSQDELRDDLTIVAARVKAPPQPAAADASPAGPGAAPRLPGVELEEAVGRSAHLRRWSRAATPGASELLTATRGGSARPHAPGPGSAALGSAGRILRPGHDLGGHLGHLDVTALGLPAQPLQRVLGVAAERVHQDALGLVHHRAGHYGVFQLAGGALGLAVGGRVGQHGPAESGQRVRHRIGLCVQHAGPHAEERQDEGSVRDFAHQVD